MGGAECTPAAEKALKAWLAANTPSQPGRGSAYRGNQTPGRLLATPALQGLLQQLRISTPALGAQVYQYTAPTIAYFYQHYVQISMQRELNFVCGDPACKLLYPGQPCMSDSKPGWILRFFAEMCVDIPNILYMIDAGHRFNSLPGGSGTNPARAHPRPHP